MTLHYHGCPITPTAVMLTLAGKLFCVSHARPDQVELDCTRLPSALACGRLRQVGFEPTTAVHDAVLFRTELSPKLLPRRRSDRLSYAGTLVTNPRPDLNRQHTPQQHPDNTTVPDAEKRPRREPRALDLIVGV